ncbi:MAG: hypothetical protein AAFR68_18425 [Pseudomonadota bacterium]
MDSDRSYFTLTIDTAQPVELDDFIGQLTSLGRQFDRYMAMTHPELAGEAKFYIKEVRKGSFIVDILPVFLPLVEHIQHINILDEFATNWATRIKTYFQKGGRDQTAGKSDLQDVLKTVRALARDADGSVKLDFVAHEDGKRDTRTILAFQTPQAVQAEREIEDHMLELDAQVAAEHSRVVMVFSRPDRLDAKIGERSGEKVIIDSISPKPRPLIYASELAEQRIKSEIREAETNIFNITFVVDVNVEMRNNKPYAYRVTHVHQVIIDDVDEGS